jgi:hypothetical protein
MIMSGPDVVEFVSAESSISGKTVKGAPYSAEAVTESTQTLADGNRIVSKSTALVYRDSQGRTRREMSLTLPGMPDAPTFITINDPIAGSSYHLDPQMKVARKLPVAPDGMSFGIAGVPGIRATRGVIGGAVGAVHERGETDVLVNSSPASRVQIMTRVRPNGEPTAKSESLGKRMIDGVEADGTRSTMTIPAGQMGNERDINIVTERWYSPELQTVISSKHSDPRSGETTYTLTNLKRSDPHPSLFQVPSDYTTANPSDYTTANDEGMPNIRVIRKIERK